MELGELLVDSGMMVNVNDIEFYHPVMLNGSTGRLHYAKADGLEYGGDSGGGCGAVLVTVWG